MSKEHPALGSLSIDDVMGNAYDHPFPLDRETDLNLDDCPVNPRPDDEPEELPPMPPKKQKTKTATDPGKGVKRRGRPPGTKLVDGRVVTSAQCEVLTDPLPKKQEYEPQPKPQQPEVPRGDRTEKAQNPAPVTIEQAQAYTQHKPKNPLHAPVPDTSFIVELAIPTVEGVIAILVQEYQDFLEEKLMLESKMAYLNCLHEKMTGAPLILFAKKEK